MKTRQAVFLQNILPTKPVKLSPYEIWYDSKPDVKNLRVFGCSAWVHIPKEKRKKLAPTAKELVFVGYSLEHKAYRFLDRSTKKVIVSRDVRFIESALEVGADGANRKQKSLVRPVSVPGPEETIVFDLQQKKSDPIVEVRVEPGIQEGSGSDVFNEPEAEAEDTFRSAQ